MNESERMAQELAALSSPRIKSAIMYLRRVSRQHKRVENWVLAADLFGHGLTYSRALCRMHGLDPEARE